MAGRFSDARNERDRADRERAAGKQTNGGGGVIGAGTQSVMAGAGTRGYQAPGSAKAADKAWQGAGNRVVNGRAEGGAGSPGGGTTTTMQQTPGAVPNFPDADGLTVAEKIFGPLVPGAGSLLGVATVGKMLDEDSTGPTTVFGGDPGPQRGFQPDRFKGKASVTNVGDTGSASGLSADERSIPGARFREEMSALVGDDSNGVPAWSGDPFSDVVLKDRRKPYDQMTLTQLASF